MKKFISMVMAASMVVSLVPATAFAYEVSSTAKILDAAEMTEKQAKKAKENGIVALAGEEVDQPELQVKLTDDSYTIAEAEAANEYEVTLTLSNAEFMAAWDENLTDVVSIVRDGGKEDAATSFEVVADEDDIDEDEITFTIKTGEGKELKEDDKVVIDLSNITVTKTSAGAEATVSIDSDDLGIVADDLVFAVVQDDVLKIKVKDTTDVAEEEVATLEKVTIEAATGYLPSADKDGKDLKLKLNSGFEFVDKDHNNELAGKGWKVSDVDDNELWIDVDGSVDKIEIAGLEIEAISAKEGATATITVSATSWEKASVEVAKVVGEGLTIEVDEDEDVPEMWSGVAADTKYLTDDDDNTSLKFTIKETVAGAYSEKDAVELVLPEGVWVVGGVDGVVVTEEDGDGNNDWDALFAAAYQEGDHESFNFKRRTIDETTEDAMEIGVELELVADPGFVGDVTVKMLVDGEEVGEVTIATFKAPVIVEAQQNDLIIDYRNTEVPTPIVVKEAEAGLWAKGLKVNFGIDKFEEDWFEDDMVYEVNEDESGMEITGEDDYLAFEVDEESDDEPAVITISNISLYMSRNLAAGSYDLTMGGDVFVEYNEQTLFAPDCDDADCDGKCDDKNNDCIVYDVADFSDVVKEGFVNIITSGRDKDDASFTTKVVVPVGENVMYANEQEVTLDVPAYINANGYTMLPVRAVAVALGIDTNNVLWNQPTKTVTILYGQRIITMTAGQKVVNVNGSALPATAAVEIVNGRTFLGMRDLATALGVTDITWDAATQTATLNGNK